MVRWISTNEFSISPKFGIERCNFGNEDGADCEEVLQISQLARRVRGLIERSCFILFTTLRAVSVLLPQPGPQPYAGNKV